MITNNLKAAEKGEPAKEFRYLNLGAMATIGRNKAVADIAGMHLSGFIAWIMWMTIHLRSILGAKKQTVGPDRLDNGLRDLRRIA